MESSPIPLGVVIIQLPPIQGDLYHTVHLDRNLNGFQMLKSRLSIIHMHTHFGGLPKYQAPKNFR